MLVITNRSLLKKYAKLSDKEEDIKNFRLYFEGKETNLIWYDGKIIYLPKEYFELRNLINVDMTKREKCAIFLYELNLIKELKSKNISFLLEDNLAELIKSIDIFVEAGLSDNIALEFIDDKDYSKVSQPIYLGNGVWINREEK